MEIVVTRTKEHTIVALNGRLNTQTMPAAEEKMQELLDSENAIVLDMAGLEYIASCGLRLLVSAQKRLSKRDGTLVLRNVNASIREILEITGLDSVLTIE